MYRLFIIFLFINITNVFLAQTSKRELLYLVQLNLEQEDYTEAEILYDSILKKDSLNCKILDDFSLLLISTKKIEKAKFMLEKLQKLDKKNIYEPKTSLNLGLISKQMGDYEKAIDYFKNVTIFRKKKQYIQYVNKGKREIESCNWAIENKKDTLKYSVNKIHGLSTNDSEFGHAIDGKMLIISSLKCKNCDETSEISSENYLNKIYTINKENGNQLNEINSINSKINHTSNGTFSTDRRYFYFSNCDAKSTSKNCKILVSNYEHGIWSNPDTLIGEVNEKKFSFTMPAFGTIKGTDYLFFCSDKKNGKGELDIFYGYITGKTIKKVKEISNINSIENEITPFFDNNTSMLYFSSTWLNGFGGYDIHKTLFNPNKDSEILNLGIPFNSTNNDTYIIKDSTNFYVTSNRNHTSENKICCSDIYILKPIIKNKCDSTQKQPKIDSLKFMSENLRFIEKEKNIEKLEQLIPVSLYFHNDIPNPKTKDSISYINYLETYNDYNHMISTYTSNYSKRLLHLKKIEAEKEITNFFQHNLQKGKKDLDEFLQLLEIELKLGTSFELIFRGYASPLAKTDYNKYLSKRRINSVRNYIVFYKNGILLKYLIPQANEKAKLTFREEPLGEYNADMLVSDNPYDLRNSVYSKKAALERKVEIIGFRVL